MRNLALTIVVCAVACSDEVVWLTATAPADGCPNGGTNVSIGPDENDNGLLDASEVRSTSPICSPEAQEGNDEFLAATSPADTDACPWGGTLIHFGRDTDGNGVLDGAEFASTQPLCNGAVTPSGVSRNWTGAGGDDLWSNPANWAGGISPRPGDDVVFAVSSGLTRTRNDLGVAFAVGDLRIAGGFELYGEKVIVLGELHYDGLTRDAPSTVELPLVFLASTTVTVDDDPTVEVDLTLTGPIEGVDGLVKADPGTLALRGDNRYRGATRIDEGLVIAATANAIPAGSGVSVQNNGTFRVSETGATCAALGGPGAVQLDGPLVIDVPSGFASFSGVLSGGAALTLRGSGLQRFNNAAPSSYTGTATVEAGTLEIFTDWPNANVDVGSLGTLVGDGTLAALTARGTVAPGGAGIGRLAVTGDMDLRGARLEIQLDGNPSDIIAAAGNLDLTDTVLVPSLLAGYVPGGPTIIPIGEVGGTITAAFVGVAEGGVIDVGGSDWLVSYAGGDIELTLAP